MSALGEPWNAPRLHTGGSAPWVLLRGLTRDARHWGGFAAAWREAFPGAVVLTPDLPGNGTRRLEPSPARIEGLLAALRADLARQGQAPPFRLFGLSMGGMVATAWAVAHPDEVEAAVLVSCSLRPCAPMWQRLRPTAWPALAGLALGSGDALQAERSVLRLTSRLAPATLAPVWAAWRRDAPVARRNALRQLVAAARFRGPPRAPAVPLLLLAGGRDALVDPRCSQALAAAWGCPLAVHPEAGHDLPLDAPGWVLTEVRAWLGDR